MGTGVDPVGRLQIGFLPRATNSRNGLLANGITQVVAALFRGLRIPTRGGFNP